MKLFILSLMANLLFCNLSFAKEFTLLEMTNEEDSDLMYLVISVNDETEAIETINKDVYNKKGVFLYRNSWTTEGINEGFCIFERSDLEIVNIQSPNFSPYYGGDIEVNYLVNGITGKRSSFDTQLINDDNKWKVMQGDKELYRLHFKSKKILGKTVGIADIIIK